MIKEITTDLISMVGDMGVFSTVDIYNGEFETDETTFKATFPACFIFPNLASPRVTSSASEPLFYEYEYEFYIAAKKVLGGLDAGGVLDLCEAVITDVTQNYMETDGKQYKIKTGALEFFRKRASLYVYRLRVIVH